MTHLIVIQSGLNGWSYFMNWVRDVLRECLDDRYVIEISDVNNFTNTWYGVDNCGINLVKFVYECSKKHNPKYISFIGHSFGGLIIRNCIGRLECVNYFDGVKPILYASVATPHLGSLSLNNIRQFLARHLIGWSGQELLFEDQVKILMLMSKVNSCYYNGLKRFKLMLAYGNIKNDNMVTFESACISYPLKRTLSFEHINRLIVIDPEEYCEIPDYYSQEELAIFSDLSELPWIRKGIDLSNYFKAHNAIMNTGLSRQTQVIQDIAYYLRDYLNI